MNSIFFVTFMVTNYFCIHLFFSFFHLFREYFFLIAYLFAPPNCVSEFFPLFSLILQFNSIAFIIHVTNYINKMRTVALIWFQLFHRPHLSFNMPSNRNRHLSWFRIISSSYCCPLLNAWHGSLAKKKNCVWFHLNLIGFVIGTSQSENRMQNKSRLSPTGHCKS